MRWPTGHTRKTEPGSPAHSQVTTQSGPPVEGVGDVLKRLGQSGQVPAIHAPGVHLGGELGQLRGPHGSVGDGSTGRVLETLTRRSTSITRSTTWTTARPDAAARMSSQARWRHKDEDHFGIRLPARTRIDDPSTLAHKAIECVVSGGCPACRSPVCPGVDQLEIEDVPQATIDPAQQY